MDQAWSLTIVQREMRMAAVLMCVAAFLAGGLTLFSGFGLGTLLMPVVALFLPVEAAIAVTAIVHLVNNLAKLALVGRFAKNDIVFRFGVPALLASMGGALVLQQLSGFSPLTRYEWLGRQFEILPVKAVIAALLVAFLYMEARLPEHEWPFDERYLPLGGLLSGFFGGLSGHQGAFRSMYLVNAGLTKEQFLGTGVVIACLVDFARLAVYGVWSLTTAHASLSLMMAVTGSALAGTIAATRLMHAVAMKVIRALISVLLILIALGLGTGII
jgi:uncharacterized membrane protein YfcA